MLENSVLIKPYMGKAYTRINCPTDIKLSHDDLWLLSLWNHFQFLIKICWVLWGQYNYVTCLRLCMAWLVSRNTMAVFNWSNFMVLCCLFLICLSCVCISVLAFFLKFSIKLICCTVECFSKFYHIFDIENSYIVKILYNQNKNSKF